MKRIAAFTRYGREAASTRQRILQYREPFDRAGLAVEPMHLLPDSYVRSLATGERFRKTQVAAAYLRRARELLGMWRFDAAWVHIELFPFLPHWFDRLLFRHRRPVVVDWDDAFFLKYRDFGGPIFRPLFARKLERLIARADAVTCGNDYLAECARQYCDRVLVVPTVVDTTRYVPAASPPQEPVIGWIGSPSTWANVRPLLPLISAICETKGASFVAVGAGRVPESDRLPHCRFVDWAEADEIAAVQGFTIGIMPLNDAPFERGKSGYKLVQYMACGLPCVASPIGVNARIVKPGVTGFLANGMGEWEEALTALLDDAALASRLGAAGRAVAVERYSMQSQAPRLIELFHSLIKEG